MTVPDVVKAIILLRLDGKRALAKYFDDKINPDRFDRQLFKNTGTKDEVLVIDKFFVAHRCVADLHVYVAGNKDVPLMLNQLLCCITEAIFTLMSRNPEQQSLNENLDQLILAIDEVCNEGIVTELDPEIILKTVSSRDGNVSEQSMVQVIQSATEHLKFPWIRS